MNKLKSELDLTKEIDRLRRKYEVKIAKECIKYLGIKDMITKEDITQSYEQIKNYPVKVYTFRVFGKLIYRRFNEDFAGTKFRYESPIFNNVSDDYSD